MIEQILKSLVLENRRLIIPTIGAFLTKELADKQIKVTFSSFLKYDDGLLIKLLCEHTNISEAEAKQEVANFAQRVSNALDSGNNYPVINFGYFMKDKNDIIDFIVENLNTRVEIVTPKIEEPIIPPYVPPVFETPVFETPVYEAPVFVQPPIEQNNDFDFSKIVIPSSSSPTTNVNVRPPKKSTIGYWILAIILVIIAALLLLYLFSKEFKQTVNSLFGSKQTTTAVKTDPVKTVDTTKTKTITQDTVATKQTQTTKQEQPIQPSKTVEGGKYQVILGSYLERSVAEDYANKLRNKGYSVTIPDRLAGEWIILIAYESNDREDAERMKNQFMSEGYDDAYVRIRPGGVAEKTTKQTVATQQQSNKSNSNANFNTTLPSKRGKYQVIAGCFLERSNAQKRGRELSSKGFDVTVPDKLYGEWVIVIVHESDDKSEAKTVMNQCIAAGYADAWIRTR